MKYLRFSASALVLAAAATAGAQPQDEPLPGGDDAAVQEALTLDETPAPDGPIDDDLRLPPPETRIEFVTGFTDRSDLKGGGEQTYAFQSLSINSDIGFVGLDGSRPKLITEVRGPVVRPSLGGNFTVYQFDLDALGPQGLAAGLDEDVLDTAYEFSVSPRATIALSRELGLLVGGGVAFGFEEGADVGDALTWNALIALRREVGPRLALIGGVAVGDRLEDSILVLPGIGLTLTPGEDGTGLFINAIGPSIEVGYAVTPPLRFSIRGEFDGNSLLLEDERVIARQAVTLDAGVEWRPTERLTVEGRVGSDVYTRYELRDGGDDEIFDVEAEPALVVSAVVGYRF
jgi:hypothetical protein